MAAQEEQQCPVCGCEIDDESLEMGGILYCGEACANGSACECGCMDESELDCR